jgi:hypothetical protein
MTHSKTWRSAAAGLATLMVGSAAFLFGHGCGSVSNDRQDAINQATNAACQRYQTCGAIGKGLSYESVSDCQADWKSKFTTQWTEAQCQARIDHAMLNNCVERIDSTMCTSILDVLNTFYVVCSAANVCDIHDAGTG